MLIARTQKYAVQFWTSDNLKEWKHASDFQMEGILGWQYEMPNLMRLPVENPSKVSNGASYKWVLTLALHPGSPLGGPLNQYFIGDFDGEKFSLDDHATRLMDYGKDFYSFTTFDSADEADGPNLGLAWATNWQYATVVPTENFRSSMTMVRNYTLRYVDYNPEYTGLTLVQTPVLETKETRENSSIKSWEKTQKYTANNVQLNSKSNLHTNFNLWNNASGVLDFNITLKSLQGSGWSNGLTPAIEIEIQSDMVWGKKDNISVVFDNSGTTWMVDRTTDSDFQRNSHEFTEKLGQYVNPRGTLEDGSSYYTIYGFVDRDILEVYFNDGELTMTQTFFFGDGRVPADIRVFSGLDDAYLEVVDLEINAYGLKN